MTDPEIVSGDEPDRMVQLIRAVNLVTESNIEIIKRQDRIIELLAKIANQGATVPTVTNGAVIRMKYD